MKRMIYFPLFALCFCLISIQATAQINHVVTIAPLGLINKVRLKYELSPTENLGFGAITSFHHAAGVFPGFKGELFGRLYLGREAPKGLYFQGKFIFGSFKTDNLVFDEYVFDNGLAEPEVIPKRFTTFGGGLNVGYQFLVGRNDNWVIDLNGGFKALPFPDDLPALANQIVWILTGPGSIWDGTIAIGYRF